MNYLEHKIKPLPKKPGRKRTQYNAFGEINPDNPPANVVRQSEAARRYGLTFRQVHRLTYTGRVTVVYGNQNTRWVKLDGKSRNALKGARGV